MSASGLTTLKIALENYDRHVPFFDGTVPPPEGIAFEVFEVGQSTTMRDGTDRHGRMLKNKEFDICEFSISSYLMAKSRGMPITAIPIFPRRLFSQSQMFVHPDSTIHHPKDLVGKKVLLSSFQTTLSLLAKGDLKFEYGVAWEDIKWCVVAEEKVAFEKKAGVSIETIGKYCDVGEMLAKGEIDAFFLPHPPHSVMAGQWKTRRLFADTKAEELRYFRKNGYFPIMHLMAMSEELVAAKPWLPKAMIACYEHAKEISCEYYHDPAWSRQIWGRHYFEEERDLFGADPWPNGMKANYRNLERFIEYSFDQNLLAQTISVDSLFPSQVHDT